MMGLRKVRKQQGGRNRLKETGDRKTEITENTSVIKEKRRIKDKRNMAQSSCQ